MARNNVMTVKEVMEACACAETKAYAIIRDLNSELNKKGFITVAGRVSRKYFNERFYGTWEAQEG